MIRKFTVCVYTNALLVIILSLYLFVAPILLLAQDLSEPALSSGEVPRFAFRWHRALSTDLEDWARQRVASGKAATLSVQDISGTEWPVFSSVFYLWATEALQEAWEKDPTLSAGMPKEYARGAIEAAAALVGDPKHAAWVQNYWGDDYLTRENLFYRMLLISGLTSYQKLSGNDRYRQLLSEQVDSLATELDASPYGLLDDYPGQCYPIDILPAIAAIRRADAVLGTDHAAFVARALRAFEDTRLDPSTGLPAYIADSKTGLGSGPARGVGIAYMLIWTPELWPETSRQWYGAYQEHFWQQNRAIAGVREFSQNASLPFAEWSLSDVDAGPVVAGYGTAASAFGIGAARANGHLDQAYALSAEALMVSWPLPDGTLFMPRMLSNRSDAPYVGETILLFDLTRRPVVENIVAGQNQVPLVVYFGMAFYLVMGGIFAGSGVDAILRWEKLKSTVVIPGLTQMFWARLILMIVGIGLAMLIHPLIGLLPLVLSQLFPRSQRN